MCPVNMAFGTTRFQSDGTARGSIRPEPALALLHQLPPRLGERHAMAAADLDQVSTENSIRGRRVEGTG